MCKLKVDGRALELVVISDHVKNLIKWGHMSHLNFCKWCGGEFVSPGWKNHDISCALTNVSTEWQSSCRSHFSWKRHHTSFAAHWFGTPFVLEVSVIVKSELGSFGYNLLFSALISSSNRRVRKSACVKRAFRWANGWAKSVILRKGR